MLPVLHAYALKLHLVLQLYLRPACTPKLKMFTSQPFRGWQTELGTFCYWMNFIDSAVKLLNFHLEFAFKLLVLFGFQGLCLRNPH